MHRPRLTTMLWRGARRRCPVCGGRGAFFTSWFEKAPSCQTCGLQWRRESPRFEASAGSTAIFLVFGLLTLVMTPIVVLSWPNLAPLALGMELLAAGTLLSVLIYPVSFTVWQAIDISKRPVEPEHYDLDHLASSLLGTPSLGSDALAD